jgi:STAS-like domain of unknown function (DUF4325)
MTRKIFSLTGKYAITPSAGQATYDVIHPLLLAGQQVELDFEVFASPFFNYAVGQLLRDIDPNTLSQLLKVTHLTLPGETAIHRVLENSTQYYSNEKIRQAHDRVLSEQAASV